LLAEQSQALKPSQGQHPKLENDYLILEMLIL